MSEDEKILEQEQEQPKQQAELPIVEESVVVEPEVIPEEIALETVRETLGDAGDIVTLQNGYRVQFCPVPQNAIINAAQKIRDPKPPLKPHPSDPKRAPVPSPDAPEYLAILSENELKRSDAIQDILFSFGMELVDPLPEDDKWMYKLAMNGLIKKDKIAEADELQKELCYKKYMVADAQVYSELAKRMGISEEGIAQASAAFKSNP